MSSESEELAAWGEALGNVLANRNENEDDDEPNLDVLSDGGLPAKGAAAPNKDDLPYVVLLKAAVTMVKSGELSMDEYVEGVKKLDVIADNALKIYSIPAVKTDLPDKLEDHQYSIVTSLEAQIHKMKKGLGILLSYPETQAAGDLETGLETAVSAMNAIGQIQKQADAERARILEQEKEEKAKRAQKAAEAEA